MKKLDKNTMKILQEYYFLSAQKMALSVDEGPEYWRHENVFIMHRIGPHELETIGGGTV